MLCTITKPGNKRKYPLVVSTCVLDGYLLLLLGLYIYSVCPKLLNYTIGAYLNIFLHVRADCIAFKVSMVAAEQFNHKSSVHEMSVCVYSQETSLEDPWCVNARKDNNMMKKTHLRFFLNHKLHVLNTCKSKIYTTT